MGTGPQPIPGRYPKQPLTLDEQVDLIIERGLKVSDRQRALRWLRRVNYYRFTAYLFPFKFTGTDRFKPGTKLDQVIDMYKFDARLRLLILQAVDRVEVAIRAVITYEFAHHTNCPFGYADSGNFSPKFDHAKLMDVLRKEESRSSEAFVKHYRKTYHAEPYLPIWMVTEILSFGPLSHMYGGLKRDLQRKIADDFGVPEGSFKTWMHALNNIRNACAHHNRVWNRSLGIKPTFPPNWPYHATPPDRIYGILVILQHMLLIIAPKCKWSHRLKALFKTHPGVHLLSMGVPSNWTTLDPWRGPTLYKRASERLSTILRKIRGG